MVGVRRVVKQRVSVDGVDLGVGLELGLELVWCSGVVLIQGGFAKKCHDNDRKWLNRC